MDYQFAEWTNLIVRWIHVFAGILWIGQTYFFTWLDGRLTEEEAASARAPSGPPQVWMVHSGGFYVVERRRAGELLPRRLHWFRWEAALTWLSGAVLLVLVYDMGGLLVDRTVSDASPLATAALGWGVIIAGWLVYDAIWRSPLASSERAGIVLCFVLLGAVAFGLSRVMSGRAAYMHVGALMGTIMAANVWLRILPTQRYLTAPATASAPPPDPAVAKRAKNRTRHNTYMVVPVVFIMLSNHFPVATYGHRDGWLILMGLIVAGWVAAHYMRK